MLTYRDVTDCAEGRWITVGKSAVVVTGMAYESSNNISFDSYPSHTSLLSRKSWSMSREENGASASRRGNGLTKETRGGVNALGRGHGAFCLRQGTDVSLSWPVMQVYRFPKAPMSISSQIRRDDPSAPTCFAHQSMHLKVVSARYAS